MRQACGAQADQLASTSAYDSMFPPQGMACLRRACCPPAWPDLVRASQKVVAPCLWSRACSCTSLHVCCCLLLSCLLRSHFGSCLLFAFASTPLGAAPCAHWLTPVMHLLCWGLPTTLKSQFVARLQLGLLGVASNTAHQPQPQPVFVPGAASYPLGLHLTMLPALTAGARTASAAGLDTASSA